MFICYVSVFYVAYFDDRWMADRIVLSIAWVYILAVPFYLFFNVRVTGDVIPGMETIAYDLTPRNRGLVPPNRPLHQRDAQPAHRHPLCRVAVPASLRRRPPMDPISPHGLAVYGGDRVHHCVPRHPLDLRHRWRPAHRCRSGGDDGTLGWVRLAHWRRADDERTLGVPLDPTKGRAPRPCCTRHGPFAPIQTTRRA